MRHFPWQTVALLGLTSYLLLLLGGLWWRALGSALAAGLHLSGGPDWEAVINFGRWFPGEPWVDAVVIHVGALYILWRWAGLLRALWERYRP